MKERELLQKIGKRIREERNKQGMSQQELGALVDQEKSNMSRLEAGNVNSGILIYHRIAKALNISLSDLFNGIK